MATTWQQLCPLLSLPATITTCADVEGGGLIVIYSVEFLAIQLSIRIITARILDDLIDPKIKS